MQSERRAGSLRELCPVTVGSERLNSALAGICAARALRPSDWRPHWPDRAPDLLLIEAADGIEAQWGAELDALLAHCDVQGVPRLLWIGISPLTPYWLERCAGFNRVFTMDVGQIEPLEASGARAPAPLWPATALPIAEATSTGAGDRPYPVAWLGGWRSDWPATWTRRLTSILRGAAECGLRIFEAGPMDGLPADLQPCLTGRDGDDAEAVLRGAKVVVCADAAIGSATFAPAVVFDAAACGATVVTPHRFANRYDFGVKLKDEATRGGAYDTDASSNPFWDLVPYVADRDTALERLALLLGDDSLREESARHLRRIVHHDHTYANRLATLASAAGHRLAPDAP
jgi:hypothetical protein